jgi:hypothetical protein
MAIGKRKMTEMSKPAEILYRAIFDELRFAKQQQWVITNYVLLLMGAVFGIAKATSNSPTPCEKVVWCVVVAAIWGIALFRLLNLQVSLHNNRARQKRMEQTFSPEDRRLVQDKPPAEGAEARDPIEWFAAVLCAVVTAAGLGTGYAAKALRWQEQTRPGGQNPAKKSRRS